jgi:hypothetical protein
MGMADWIQENFFPDPAAQREKAEQERERQQRMARGQAAKLPYNPPMGLQGAGGFMGFANAAMAPGMNAHAAAVNQVNDVISQEMQSRVAQAREARRMQHEKDMLLMRLRAMRGQ